MIQTDEKTDEKPTGNDAILIPSSQDTPHAPQPFRFGLRMAILSGLLLWLAHPLPGMWPLAWFALAPLILAVQQAQGVRKAAWIAYCFGWAYLAPTWYWTGLTIVGWTGSPIGWAALLLLTLLAAGFYAAWGAFTWWLSRRISGAWRMVGVASAWVVMEWLRSVGSLSFPWAQVCYTQYRFLPLIQVAEVTGALGVSFLVLLVNTSLAEWQQNRKQPQSQRWVASCVTLIGLLCLSGLARMVQLQDGRPIHVAVMQGNFDYKSGRDIRQAKMQTFEALTHAAYQTSTPKPDLYVWAESAAPGDSLHETDARQFLQKLADDYKAPILTGATIVDPVSRAETNSALLFVPGRAIPERFDKIGVVPFGEFIPFRKNIPAQIQKQFQFFDTDVEPGKTLEPMRYEAPGGGEVALGPFICYESVYPHYSRMMVRGGAKLLVTPSHDQWFQSEAAMEQHLAIVVLRAVENRRDIARATTDGISAVIDGRGHILARAPLSTACFLVRQLHLRSLLTIYARFGDWFVGLCAILVLAASTHRQLAPWLKTRASSRKPGQSSA